jgi:hypothetical protein
MVEVQKVRGRSIPAGAELIDSSGINGREFAGYVFQVESGFEAIGFVWACEGLGSFLEIVGEEPLGMFARSGDARDEVVYEDWVDRGCPVPGQ